jgi:hypothetical protein
MEEQDDIYKQKQKAYAEDKLRNPGQSQVGSFKLILETNI